MFKLLKPIYLTYKPLTTSLFLALGLTNIKEIEYCMSRIRILVKDSKIIAEDSIFLEMQAKGVIREGNSIHLIFGQNSVIIGEQLQILLDIFKDKSIIQLFLILKGIRNIKTINLGKKNIQIILNDISYIDQSLLSTLNTSNTNYKLVEDGIDIECNNIEVLGIKLQYTMLYWDLIQGVHLFEYIPVDYIEQIDQANYGLQITLLKPINIIMDDWKKLDLSIEKNALDSKILLINGSTQELFDICLKYLSFWKK